MKRLIFIRHSNAESGSFEMSDFERRLTPKGIKRAQRQANELKSKAIVPNLIITSNAARAIETTNIFHDIIGEGCKVQEVPFLYDDFTTSDFFNLINSIDESYSTVLLIGHNPTISDMISKFDFDFSISLRPCEIVIISIEDLWKTVEVDGGNIVDIISPKN